MPPSVQNFTNISAFYFMFPSDLLHNSEISELDSADSEKHSSKLDQVIFKLDQIDFYWPVTH